MPTDVIMPQMGESIFEGTITRWLKKAGDLVQKDEPLFEISTDKVDAEIPSPVAGILSEIRFPEGATVGVNTVVAVIGSPSPDAPPDAAPVAGPALQVSAAPAPAVSAVASRIGEHLRSSPLVRKIAKENSLDLGRIAGTGSAGRITKEDVLRYLSQHGPGREAGVPAGAAPSTLIDRLEPLSKMRTIIARRMVESLAISPHAHTVYKVDMTRIARIREREKAKFEQKNGVRLTYMPFIAAAVVEALRRFPIVNASLENGAIHYHGHINLGIAVALEWGLIVPVVKEAEGLSFVGLAAAIADLGGRARSKRLLPEEVSGSTFTLTNSGVFGGEFGTPIINQSESAILAIGGLKKEPVVLTDSEGNDTIAIRSMQHFCLGFDHRIIDGADAGKFMGVLQRTLEEWDRGID